MNTDLNDPLRVAIEALRKQCLEVADCLADTPITAGLIRQMANETADEALAAPTFTREWYKVSEQLPEKDGDYPVCFGTESQLVGSARFSVRRKQFSHVTPTHWTHSLPPAVEAQQVSEEGK